MSKRSVAAKAAWKTRRKKYGQAGVEEKVLTFRAYKSSASKAASRAWKTRKKLYGKDGRKSPQKA